jgi:hypothetical protein
LEQTDLLSFTVDHLERLGLTYMVVGSYASGAYGEPRFTQDIDIVVDLQAADVDRLCAIFPPGEFYVSHEAALAAVQQRGQFNVIHQDTANKIDFMIARKDPWGVEQLKRRVRVKLLPKQEGFAARPEDIIISKLIYYQEGGSEKHLRDITGMFMVSGRQIDRHYIDRWVQQLGLTADWNAVLTRLAPT